MIDVYKNPTAQRKQRSTTKLGVTDSQQTQEGVFLYNAVDSKS